MHILNSSTSQADHIRQKFLYRAIFIILLSAVFAISMNVFVVPSSENGKWFIIEFLLLIVVVCLYSIILARRGQIRAGPMILILSMIGFLFINIDIGGITYGPQGMFYIVPVLMAGMLLGFSYALLLTILCSLLLIVPQIGQDVDISTASVPITIFVTVSLLILAVIRTFEQIHIQSIEQDRRILKHYSEMEIAAARAETAEVQIQLAAKKTDEEIQARRFIRYFQHELRAYATSLEGFVQISRMVFIPSANEDTPISIEPEQIISNLEEISSQLSTLTEQLLIITRSGKLPLTQRKSIDPLVFLSRIKDEFNLQTQYHTSLINIDIDLLSKNAIHGDALLILLALRTAIRNAVESMIDDDAGTIILRVKHDNNQTILHIQDTGPGFPSAVLSLLQQGVTEDNLLGWTTKMGGNGIGLALMIQVTRLHEGSISFYNNPDGGGIVELGFPTFSENGAV
jgi:signal transduction histidine kinase